MASGTAGVPDQLTKSFAAATEVARQYPQYADQITAAKASFLQGDQWTYAAGIAAILVGEAVGAALVWFLFPKKRQEEQLLAQYCPQDTPRSAGPTPWRIAT
jgi:hypothetical protein